MRGATMPIGGPGSGTEWTAARMLDVAGGSGATAPLVENIRLFCAGDSDIGFTLADTAADAVEGTAGFEGFVRAGAQPAGAASRPPVGTPAPDPARLAELAAEYGIDIIGPPGIPA